MRALCIEGQLIRAADEVVLSVEASADNTVSLAENGPLYSIRAFHSDTLPRMLAEAKTSTIASGEAVEYRERKLCEETNDAIWEEGCSPDLEFGWARMKDPRGTHLSLERLDHGLQSLSRVKEARHRSLDFDVHITEPSLVKLQDKACKPLSDLLSENNFTLRPKSSGADMRSSLRPPAKLPSVSARGNPEHAGAQCPLPQDVPASAGNEHRSSFELGGDVGMLDVSQKEISKQEQPSRQSVSDDKNADEASLVTSCDRQEEAGKKSDNASREIPKNLAIEKLRKAKSKSRFVEPTFSLRPDKKSTQLRSSGRLSTRKAERAEDDEEDPFKDIDSLDNFRRGNFKCVTLTQWAAFFIITTCLVSSLTVARLENHQVWGLELWKWFLSVLVVLCGRLVSGWLIRVLVILFERNFLLRKKVLYFVYGLRKGVQNCLWLGLVLLSWKLIFDPRVKRSRKSHKILSHVTKLLECFLFAAVFWLLKILLVKVLASSFHVSTFFDRLQESLFNQYVLEVLSGPPLLESRNPHQQRIRVQALQKLNRENVSAGHMKALMNLVRHPGFAKLVTTIDESVSLDEDDLPGVGINNEMQAKAAANRIFRNVAQPNSSSILQEDLLAFVHEEEVAKVFSSFEAATETGKITKKALKSWVVNVYKERKSLAHSLNDTKTAVDELHNMASVVVSVIIIVVWLLMLGIASTHVLLFIMSQLLLLGFIFSNTLKQVFEAIIFLFLTHPYDVGDRCVIDGVQMVVEEMNILSTIFLRADNEKVCYPNAVLATKPISNLYRSPDMKEILDFYVHISTSNKQMADLKDKIAAHVERKSAHWHPKFGMLVNQLVDLNQMRLTITMQHTINFQNMGDRLSRRSEFLLELRNAFQELGIEYRLLPQPVEITQVSTIPPPLPQQQLVPTSRF